MRSRFLVLTFLILTGIALLAVGAAVAYVQSGRLHARAAGALVATVRRELGREVRVGALEGDPFRGMVLRQVAVARGERLADGVLFSADAVVFRLRPGAFLLDLVRRRGVWATVTHITVVRPALELEIMPDGRWNVPTLGRTAPGGEPAPAPTVVVQSGTLALTDRSRPPWPFQARAVQVDGEADLRRMPVVQLRFTLVSLHDGRRTPLEISGRYIAAGGTLDLDLVARGAPLAQWGPYLVSTESLRLEGGTADADLRLLLSSWGARRVLDYHGTLRITDGAATVVSRQARLRAIRGKLQISNLRVASDDLHLRVDGTPVRIRGEATLTTPPLLDLAVRSAQADLATVQRLFFPGWSARLGGRAGTDLRVTGPLTHLTVEGTVAGLRGAINQQPMTVTSSGLQLVGDLLVLDRFAAAAGLTRAAGEMRLSIGRPEVLVAVSGVNVTAEHLRRAGLNLRLPVRGSVDGSLLLLRDAEGYRGEATAVMGPGAAAALRVDELRAGGWFDRGEVAFPYLVARRDRTTVHASGSISPRGDLALDAAGSHLDLQDVAREVGLTPRLVGTVDTEGQIRGRLTRPVFEGRFTVGPGHLAPLTFDSGEGTIRLTREELSTAGSLFRAGGGTYQVAGLIRWHRPSSSLALRVDARNIAGAALVRATGLPVRVSGAVSGRVTLSGTTQRPRASGTLSLGEGAIEGQRVEAAQATFRWEDGVLRLDEAAARIQQSRLVVRGTIDRRGPLRLGFAARGFDLRHLTILPPALQASGQVDLSGQIAGTIARPTGSAVLTSRRLLLNGQTFDRVDGNARWEADRLIFAPLTLQQGEGRYTVTGALGFAGDVRTLDLRGEISRGRLATLLAVGGRRLPFALDGTVDGRITLQGLMIRPAVTVDASLTAGRVGEHPLESAEARLSFRDDVLSVDRFAARVGRGTIAAQGRVARRGSSHLEVSGSTLDLDLLRPFLGLTRPVVGTVSFATQFSGPWEDPEIGLSLDIRDGAVNGLRFDSMVANAFYQDGLVHIEQALLSENGHRAKGVGTIPFNPTRRALDELRPMRFDISLVEADLSLLALLVPQVEDATGRIEGQVTLSGTPRHPEMTGRLATRGGRIKLRTLANWFEDVTTEIRFNADRLTITTLTARLGGGAVAAAGTVAVTNFRPGAIERLTLRARDARLEYPPFFSGDVDMDLTLGGSLLDPAHPAELAGQILLKNGDLVVRSGTGEFRWPGPDLRLREVRLTSGRGLAVHLGRLRVEVRAGSVVVARGTLRRPELDGELVAERGTMTILGRTFTLREGQARFLPQLGLRPIISLDAEAQLGATRIFLEVRQALPEEIADRLILRSDPPHSREEILQLLGQQLVAQGEAPPPGVDIQQMLAAELTRVLFGQVEEAIARGLGLSEFTIQYDFVNPLQLRIGTLLLRNLYLTLTTEFRAETRFIWALEWRFAPNVMLTFNVDNLGRSDVLIRYTYRF